MLPRVVQVLLNSTGRVEVLNGGKFAAPNLPQISLCFFSGLGFNQIVPNFLVDNSFYFYLK